MKLTKELVSASQMLIHNTSELQTRMYFRLNKRYKAMKAMKTMKTMKIISFVYIIISFALVCYLWIQAIDTAVSLKYEFDEVKWLGNTVSSYLVQIQINRLVKELICIEGYIIVTLFYWNNFIHKKAKRWKVLDKIFITLTICAIFLILYLIFHFHLTVIPQIGLSTEISIDKGSDMLYDKIKILYCISCYVITNIIVIAILSRVKCKS